MFSILYNIIISPIELVVEVVFELLFRLLGRGYTNQGLAVIGVSLAISLLTLPLYRRADAVQQKERDMQKKLSRWVAHIKKTFKGDERFMMLQTYYRENNYSPLSALNGSISLLLEIPFFIAAYHFLSHLVELHGASFGPIADLGLPDRLIHVGSFSFNLLPVLMTAINCVSSAIYLKGFPLKDKVQTYGMALIFLVLLYNSPAGLVVYWTCNNIFSLVKNVFYRLKNPWKVFCILCATLGTILFGAVVLSGILNSTKKYVAMTLFLYCTYIPLVWSALRKKRTPAPEKMFSATHPSSSPIFVLSSLVLVVLTGLLIPSSVIASSPAEFVDLTDYQNPLHFLVNATCYAIGFFLLWAGIIYKMLDEKGKRRLSYGMVIAAMLCMVNYLFFGRHLGTISAYLRFDVEPAFSALEKLINLSALAAVASLCVAALLHKHGKTIASFTMLVLLICVAGMSVSHIYRTQRQLHEMAYITQTTAEDVETNKPIFTLSKTGKNVIVFMLDRAISGYVPYLLAEKPLLQEQFAGFTYYPNTLSHGFFTNFGTPALFGGYEYTVTEMNKRNTELLGNKQDEALKVLPVLFSQHDFGVTVCDPPYAGYKWIPDLSIYDDYPNIRAYITSGKINDKNLEKEMQGNSFERNRRNFFCYALFKTLPIAVSTAFYDKGFYFSSSGRETYDRFYKEYSVLNMLPQLTHLSEDSTNQYLSIVNTSTHEPRLLQLPDYALKASVDNSGLQTAADGHIDMEREEQIMHYHVNMASFLALGKWFDFLREHGAYDNTRIIIVADHGRGLAQFDYMLMKNPEIDVEWCNPLLMVKDFGAKDFSVSSEFMTNADVPTLATSGVIENPVNPFTGKAIQNSEKTAHPQLVTSSLHYDITEYNYTTFDTSDGHWFSVRDNIFDEANWKQLD